MKHSLLLLFICFTLVSCLKDVEEPQPTICIVEPTFIGNWEQVSILENYYNKEGEKIKVEFIDFEEDDKNADKISFLLPKDEDVLEEAEISKYLGKGLYLTFVYDEEDKKMIDKKGIYKVPYFYGAAPTIEITIDDKRTLYFYKINQTEKGVILTLTNSEVDEASDSLIETILSFKNRP